MWRLTIPDSTLHSCHCGNPTRRSSRLASSSQKRGMRAGGFRPATTGGAGEPPTLPYLAGQYALYIAFELRMWQRGYRKNSPDGMAVVARALDDREIAAVAAYY